MNTDFRVLLEKEIPWDAAKVKVLDQLVRFFYANSNSANGIQANQLLTQLKEDADFWLAADSILENSEDPNTKFFALQALEQAIQSRWKIFPEEQKNAIKNYIVNMVVKMGANSNNQMFRHVLKKANLLLIQIVKQEWNTTWKNFIPDICESSKQDQNVCENNLEILKLLSEEIFDYSKNQMTSVQIRELKETMHNEFGSIYQLCYFVCKGYLDNPQQVRLSLIQACLNTLHAFLSWIPLGYVFMTDLIEILVQMFDVKELKPTCLKCLMEVVALEMEGNVSEEEAKNIKQKLFNLYSTFIFKMGSFIPSELSLFQERTKLARQKSPNLAQFDDFCQQLSIFLSGFLKTHLRWVEPIANDGSNPEQMMTIDLIKKGFQYLVHLSELPGQIFKICVDFWNEFTASLLAKGPNGMNGAGGFGSEPLLLLNSQSNVTLANSVYNFALMQIRSIMISRMAKPQEALLVINEAGIPVKQFVKNTENNSLYEVMRDLLVNLTKLDWDNMKSIMMSKLDKQLDGTEWSFDNLNSLSWAIGSISGTVGPNDEKTFLIYIIRGLLNLCEQKKGKENKAVVASDIMYVVGQYPRFLKSNWNFLKTVVKKLFEFMHESYPGVMEMAVNTFLKIAETCKEEFVIVHAKQSDFQQTQLENTPYIDELIRKIPDETNMLEAEHKFVFYEAVGHIVAVEPNFERKQYLLQGILQEYWDAWDTMLREIDINFESLRDERNIERFHFIIKVHERLAFSIGVDFAKALARIYMDLLKLYILYSRLISNDIQANPKFALNHYVIKKIRVVKREVLNLMITVVDKCSSSPILAENFIEPLMDILQDYCNNVPEAREAEVLALFTTIVEKLKGAVANLVPKILEYVFAATLSMITDDFNSNIDHRVNLFKLLLSITEHSFQALFNIPPEQFKTVIDCIVWAIKHELPAIFESGLEALILILKNVNTDQNVANQFYQIYFMSLLQDVLYVLTDGLHKSGFKQQTVLLALLFQVVITDYVTVPLTTGQTVNNKEYVYQYIVDELSKNFNTLSKNQTAQYIGQLFTASTDMAQFKVLLRDYLIKLSQYDPEAVEEGQQMQNDIE